MTDELQENRYISDNLKINPDAEFKNFHPIENEKDEFGNRIFSSDLTYKDKSGETVQSALLVTPDGEIFIKSNKHILQDIEKGLEYFNVLGINLKSPDEEKTMQLGPGKKLDWLPSRADLGQSQAFLLTIDEQKYIIKTPKSMSEQFQHSGQPYINEMLQTQAIYKELKNDFDLANTRTQKFLFASAFVSCTQFEEGKKPEFDRDPNLLKLIQISKNFVRKMNHTNDPLWKNIAIDATNTYVGDFIERQDGSFVWVDPFIYDIYSDQR